MEQDPNHGSQSSNSAQSSQITSSQGHMMPESFDGGGQEGNYSSISHDQNQSTPLDLSVTGYIPSSTQDALEYLDQVKDKFRNQPQVYNDFLEILTTYKSGDVNIHGVISRVANLFRGFPELIISFNPFLPEGCKIIQVDEQGFQTLYRVYGETDYMLKNEPFVPPPAAAVLSSPPTLPPPPPPSQQVALFQPEDNNVRQIMQTSFFSGGPMSSSSIPVAYSQARSSYGDLNQVASFYQSPRYETISPPLDDTMTLSYPDINFVSVVEPPTSSTSAHAYSSLEGTELPWEPIKFEDAITYVNKIRERLRDDPETYNKFLRVLETNVHKTPQMNDADHMEPCTTEVYSEMAKIFQNQEDLLKEFVQFIIPPNCRSINQGQVPEPVPELPKKSVKFALPATSVPIAQPTPSKRGRPKGVLKNNTSRDQSALKKIRKPKDQSIHKQRKSPNMPAFAALLPDCPVSKTNLATPNKVIPATDAPQHGILEESAFLSECQSVLKPHFVFDDVKRCLRHFFEGLIPRKHVLEMAKPLFAKHPEMYRQLRKFLNTHKKQATCEPVSQPQLTPEKPKESVTQPQLTPKKPKQSVTQPKSTPEKTNEQTLKRGKQYHSTFKKVGTSYVLVPEDQVPEICSGRTALCNEVLNDRIFSCPKNKSFLMPKKSRYEATLGCCENERFELDYSIDSNAETIRTFEAVLHRGARMRAEERNSYQLSNSLGGTSDIINILSIRRIYGERADKTIERLKRQPISSIPAVLKQLKSLDQKLRKERDSKNQTWKDLMDRHYLKSLDHQSFSFKQTDVQMIRSTWLVNEIKTIYDKRHDKNNEIPGTGPHLNFQYFGHVMLDETINLLLHHVRRQIQTHEKEKIKKLLKKFIPNLFNHTRMKLPHKKVEQGGSQKRPLDVVQNVTPRTKAAYKSYANTNSMPNVDGYVVDPGTPKVGESRRTVYKRRSIRRQRENIEGERRSKKENSSSVLAAPQRDQAETYTLFYVNNDWYVFLRLYQIILERLQKMSDTAAKTEVEPIGVDQPAVNLGLRAPNKLQPDEYFPEFIKMLKDVLDGGMELAKYEEKMRELFGIHAYICFTMNKVVTNAVRQLQTLASDKMCIQFTDLFSQAVKEEAAGGPSNTSDDRSQAEETYQELAQKIDPSGNCYKVIFHHKSLRMTMELLDGDNLERNG